MIKSKTFKLLFSCSLAMMIFPYQEIYGQNAGGKDNKGSSIEQQLNDKIKQLRQSGGSTKKDRPYGTYLRDVDHILYNNLLRANPADSCELNLKANITFDIVISKDGKVSKTKIIKSSGNKCLDNTVTSIIKKSEFPPFPDKISHETSILHVLRHLTLKSRKKNSN